MYIKDEHFVAVEHLQLQNLSEVEYHALPKFEKVRSIRVNLDTVMAFALYLVRHYSVKRSKKDMESKEAIVLDSSDKNKSNRLDTLEEYNTNTLLNFNNNNNNNNNSNKKLNMIKTLQFTSCSAIETFVAQNPTSMMFHEDVEELTFLQCDNWPVEGLNGTSLPYFCNLRRLTIDFQGFFFLQSILVNDSGHWYSSKIESVKVTIDKTTNSLKKLIDVLFSRSLSCVHIVMENMEFWKWMGLFSQISHCLPYNLPNQLVFDIAAANDWSNALRYLLFLSTKLYPPLLANISFSNVLLLPQT
ncbi:hypothetical protein RFI_32680, partial [Reticulomyxa filosa]